MLKIEEGKELKMENVLSFRKKMTQPEVQKEMTKVGRFLQDKGVKKKGPLVTTTYAIKEIDGQPMLDMEILIPMDKEIKLVGEYNFKKVIHLLNAVYTRYKGNPQQLDNVYKELMKYINEHNLQQITSGYRCVYRC
jgi:effector-binding domain-containing protein